MRINLRDITDHDNGLTIRNANYANVNVDEVGLVRVDDPAGVRNIIVVAAINVVPAIKLCTTRCLKLVPEFVSPVVRGDVPTVNASNEIWWQPG